MQQSSRAISKKPTAGGLWLLVQDEIATDPLITAKYEDSEP